MRLRSWLVPGGPTEPIDIALRLTLIVLLLRPMGPWFVGAFVLLLALLGLVGVGLRAPATWLALAALIATRLVVDWPLPDNHVYLLAYWCLGVGIALRLTEPSRALAQTGRQLLGLAFVFAVLWKAVLSPDYRDGRFFAVTLLTDDRFADSVQLLRRLERGATRRKPGVPDAVAGGRRTAGPAAPSRDPSFPAARPGGHLGRTGARIRRRPTLARANPRPRAPAGAARRRAAVLPGHLCGCARGGFWLAAARHGAGQLSSGPARAAGRVRRHLLRRLALRRDPVGIAGRNRFEAMRVCVRDPGWDGRWNGTAGLE